MTHTMPRLPRLQGRARTITIVATVIALAAIAIGGFYHMPTPQTGRDKLQAELRAVAEQYVDAANHADGTRLADLTMGAAYDDLTFDQRSLSRDHQVAPYIWTIRSNQLTDGDAKLKRFDLLTHSDDFAVVHVTTDFERFPPHAFLPEGSVMFVFQKINGRWRISATPRYYRNWDS
ncbi:nuclear transport factor 2 family protein [Mycolicibacterium sp. CBMA 226]|uniref:nuclear transport factor 2 family protein n=1 Tax=Mycolicibacterium sp. CBMA 226 TaxID=2606611 RepID=UPI0012DBE634|nr:nuclear transport factor 2 family protein [Mycolicibacterium sp. CBMA 226]MUL78250.1 nuclear transport factor 2 family protein [Mycolicibacterium sp. CBMA 226]